MGEADVNRCHTPGRRAVLRVAVLLGAVVAALGMLTDNAMAAAYTLVTFDRAAGETPESVAITPDGSAYVSLAFASQVRRITPNGSQATLTMPTAGGITVGVAIDVHHGNDLDIVVRSADPAAAGIWRVPQVGFDHPIRIAALPTTSFPNGITFDAEGDLYIADSVLGRIWRLDRGASQATVWAQGPLLLPTGESFQGFVLPGANGLKIRGKTLYVSNTSTRNIITIPIERGGTAGSMAVRFSGVQADDFAFAVNGDMYATENPLSRLVRITPGGAVSTVATAKDGLENPSDVAFDPRPGHRRDLLVTNSAYFGTHPSLQEFSTHPVGQRLP